MIKQILLATLAGSAIVFVLSAIFNSVRIAGAHPVSLPAEAALLPTLRASIPKSGIYFFHGVTSSAGMTKERKEAWQAIITVATRKDRREFWCIRRAAKNSVSAHTSLCNS